MKNSFNPDSVDFSKIKVDSYSSRFGYEKNVGKEELRWVALMEYLSHAEGDKLLAHFHPHIYRIRSLLQYVKTYNPVKVRCPSVSFYIDEDLSAKSIMRFGSLCKEVHISIPLDSTEVVVKVKSLSGPDVVLTKNTTSDLVKRLFDIPSEVEKAPKPPIHMSNNDQVLLGMLQAMKHHNPKTWRKP